MFQVPARQPEDGGRVTRGLMGARAWGWSSGGAGGWRRGERDALPRAARASY